MREGWEFKELGEVVKTGAGGTPLKSKREYYENGNIPWLLSGEVAQGEIHNSKSFITEEGLNNSSAKLFPVNSVLVAMYGATAGQVGILRFESSTNQAVCGIFPNENFIPEFLFYFFLSQKESLLLQAVGNAQPNISQAKIKKVLVPVPPLKEQKQIVTTLDKAFKQIDQAKANLEKNLNNAKELFQSKLNEVFSQRGEGWEEKKLNEFCEVKDGTHSSPKYVDEENGIPFVTQKNILKSGLSFKNTKFISQVDHDDYYRRSNVAYNDIIFSMIGANRGMACIVNSKKVFSIKNVGLIKSNKNYQSKYLLFYLKSTLAKKYVEENSSGSAQGFIGLTKLRAFPIPFVDVETQDKIVKELDKFSELSNNLQTHYQQKLNNLEELKKSILQKAFKGELAYK